MLLGVLGALALFPLSELSIQIVNALVISLLPPDPLPKMDFREGIPDEHATLVVVPMMLTSLEVVRQEVEKLEVRYLGKPRTRIFSSACFPTSRIPRKHRRPTDAACAAMRRATGSISLNRALPGRPIPAVPPAARVV